jgi:hypothetical protein
MELAFPRGNPLQAFLDPYLVSCCLPYRRYTRLTTWPGYGVALVAKREIPYGMDRLFYLWAATMAAEHGDTFRFRPGAIAAMFGGERQRQAILDGLLRVSQTYIEISRTAEERHLMRFCLPVEHLEIHGGECSIQLGSQFERERLIPASREVIAGCVRKPSMAALDLYLWQRRAAYACEATTQIPVFGDGGLLQQLGWNYTHPRQWGRARQLLRQHQALIKDLWPGCPSALTRDGNGFVLEPKE